MRALSRIVVPILVIGFVVAFFRIPTHQSVEGVWGFFEGRAKTVEEWVKSWSDDIKLPEPGSDSGSSGASGNSSSTPAPEESPNGEIVRPGTGETSTQPTPEPSTPPSNPNPTVINIKVAEPEDVNYDRKEWKHWNNLSPSCWNVREEVLFKQAESIVLLDKDNKVTEDKSKACSIESGKWIDPYTGATFTSPQQLDIDHTIPLGYAARQGGQHWGSERKRDYANSQNNNQLIAVSASANRSKSDKGPGSWYPGNPSYQCEYANNWVNIANEWDLTIAPKDADKLEEVLASC